MSECPAARRKVAAEQDGTAAGDIGFKWTNHRRREDVRSLVRERSVYPPGLRNVDYVCFDGQRNHDHTTERLQGGFKVPMESRRNLDHTTERANINEDLRRPWKRGH